MKRLLPSLLLFSIILVFLACNKRSGKPRILVFSKTAGFRHSSIPNGKAAIMKLGEENGFLVDTTEDAAYITEDSLKNYSAVVFLSSTGDILDNYQEADFERYIQAGGGYVGIHAASDCEYHWGWYGRLVGGYFKSHPRPQEAKLIVVDHNHPSTKHLPDTWTRTDEWYNFKNLNPDVHVLLKIDEKSYEGGENGDNHPMAWYHDYDGGRAWYTELGHTEESYADSNYLQHVLGGIQYAIGENLKLNYSKATTLRVPEENRFTKVPLVEGQFFEPTEMSVLPNLDILVAQRRGELMLYKNSDHSLKQVGKLDVYWKTQHTPGVNAEEGLLGLKADPDYEKNHFVYIYYSPSDTSVNRLSRFKFENDTLDMSSEKVVLQLYSQREICCHTGGSIAFGQDHMLFLSTGDNSTPFDEPGQPFVSHGFGPLDDRPGHEQYDARRTSSNSNDLRGKILRIKVNADGSYSIPEGNLFAQGTPNTRPEIYVMGDRNPYRISVDQKNGFLYWGEVGPDAANDSTDTRGPRGYDELNQARKAGYFGWPLFVGNNYPYHAYDYATGKSGPAFDPQHPVNDSRNNTGIRDLPAVSPAFIWYPYAQSPDFPQMGTGGRNAMAGPVYYKDMYPAETRMPDYYNNKLFIYEWMRNFIRVVTMRPNGDFDKMEPFMPNTKLHAVIDMEMGPDGRIYMLEYGSGWFMKNPDAGLSRIDFTAGNRPPKVETVETNLPSGALPFTVKASVVAADPEKDPITYNWKLSTGETLETKEPEASFTINKVGDVDITVTATDDKGASSSSKPATVYAGNATPDVSIGLSGNKSFYFPGTRVGYTVNISDPDDPKAGSDPENLFVSAEYIEGSDRAGAPRGHQVLSAAMMGRSLMLSLDCKNCHLVDQKSIGPAFNDVAKKYANDRNAGTYLANKIIKGGSGVWGEVAMAAHPDLKESDARQIVAWIRSLAAGENGKSLPAQGSVAPSLDKPVKDDGVLFISATYSDKGGTNIRPMSSSATVALRNSKMSFASVKEMNGYTDFDYNGTRIMITPKAPGWIAIDSIDLAGVTGATMAVGWQTAPQFGYHFELRLDGPEGAKLGEADLAGGLPTPKNGIGGAMLTFKIQAVTDGKLHNLYIVSAPANNQEPNFAALQFIQFTNR